MRIVDANILIYAYDSGTPNHQVCRKWLDARLNGHRKVGMPWSSLLAFARIVANPRIYTEPVTVSEAWDQVTDWLSLEPVFIPQPAPDHQHILGHIIKSSSITANDLPDTHLAALAIEHGLILCSTDSDFAKYRDIEWENPLAK